MKYLLRTAIVLFILFSIVLHNCYGQEIRKDSSGSKYLFAAKQVELDTFFNSWDKIAEAAGNTFGNKRYLLFYFHSPVNYACNPNEGRVFNDSQVTSLLVNYFYPVKISSKDKYYLSFAKKFALASLPVLIITDTGLSELHRVVGKFETQKIYSHLSDFIFNNKGLEIYKKQYDSGRREFTFLRDYAIMLRDANQLDSSMIMKVFNLMTTKSFSDSVNIRFVQEFIYYRFHPFVPMDHFVFKYYYGHQSEFEKYYTAAQIKSNIIWIAINNANIASKSKNKNLFREALNILKAEDYRKYNAFINSTGDTTGYITSPDLILSLQLTFYEATGNKDRQAEIIADISNRNKGNWETLNEFAWMIYQEKHHDKVLINGALEWAKMSIALNKNYYNLDTYASLLFMSGEYKLALPIAEEALKLAEESGHKQKSTITLINKIKEKINQL